MKKLRDFLPLAGLLLVAAHAVPQSKNIHESVDPYTGLKTLFLEVSTRSCPGDPSVGLHDPGVHLLFTATQNQNHTASYFISPEMDGASYTLSLRPAGTMNTLIDGVAGTLSTPAGSTTTNRYSGGHSYVHETVPFSASRADLVRLTTAKGFQFRINGQRQEVQRCTDAKRMRDLAEFLNAALAYGSYGSAKPSVGSQSKSIFEVVDPSTQLKKLTLVNVLTQPCPGDPAPGLQGTDIDLVISANQRSDGGVWYFISTDLSHGATLGLRRGEKLQTQIDGVSGAFRTINGSVVSYGPDAEGQVIPHETTAFHVHQSDLVALSKTPVLEFRINRPEGAVRRCARSDQFKDLNQFISIAAGYEPSHLAAAKPTTSR
ncbi:MAG TPA: hypothetical protein VHW70_06690 [Edaphobacter sp.]|jgi:hypothetical protein|nr:hypothetical protein [Edaphobacter sp.]